MDPGDKPLMEFTSRRQPSASEADAADWLRELLQLSLFGESPTIFYQELQKTVAPKGLFYRKHSAEVISTLMKSAIKTQARKDRSTSISVGKRSVSIWGSAIEANDARWGIMAFWSIDDHGVVDWAGAGPSNQSGGPCSSPLKVAAPLDQQLEAIAAATLGAKRNNAAPETLQQMLKAMQKKQTTFTDVLLLLADNLRIEMLDGADYFVEMDATCMRIFLTKDRRGDEGLEIILRFNDKATLCNSLVRAKDVSNGL